MKRLVLLGIVLASSLAAASVRAENCEINVTASAPTPDTVLAGEVAEYQLNAEFKNVNRRECSITAETWNWEITDVQFNPSLDPAVMTGWVSKGAEKAVFKDTGTQTTTLRNPIAKFKAGALTDRGLWRIVFRVRGSYASIDCNSCSGTGWKSFFTQIPVEVNSILIQSLTYTSDHGVLRDKTDNYEGGGERYDEPEWVNGGDDFPISHTKNATLEVKLKIVGDPGPGTWSVIGSGMTVSFPRTTFTPSAAGTTVTLSSSGTLPDKIADGSGSFNFHIQRADSSEPGGFFNENGQAIPSEMYLTYDTPQSTHVAKHQATLIRMRRAVGELKPHASNDPFVLARKVVSRQAFYASKDITNAWTVPDGPADCQSIVRYGVKVFKMTGVPGDFTHKNIWAKETAPATAIESDPPGGLCNPFRKHPTNADWYLGLSTIEAPNPMIVDDGYNCFEAVAKFTHGGTTKYFPGGVDAEFDTANEVLGVFQSLAWFEAVGGEHVYREKVHDYHP